MVLDYVSLMDMIIVVNVMQDLQESIARMVISNSNRLYHTISYFSSTDNLRSIELFYAYLLNSVNIFKCSDQICREKLLEYNRQLLLLMLIG